MGGALYCSVAISLRVTRPLSMFEDDYFSDGDIKNIIDSLGKIVDLNLYDIKKSSKEIILSIKKDVFNNRNIYKTDFKVEYIFFPNILNIIFLKTNGVFH